MVPQNFGEVAAVDFENAESSVVATTVVVSVVEDGTNFVGKAFVLVLDPLKILLLKLQKIEAHWPHPLESKLQKSRSSFPEAMRNYFNLSYFFDLPLILEY